MSPERRVVAVVLPELLVELATVALRGPSGKRAPPLGAIMVAPEAPEAGQGQGDAAEPVASLALEPTQKLAAVSAAARRFGVREGQSIAEACALLSSLVVRAVPAQQVSAELGRIAEAALACGTPVAFEAPDTVWVDVTGSAHLMGGEAALVAELSELVRGMGHVVQVAVASGPRLARAFARWGGPGQAGLVVPPNQQREMLQQLPITALPIAVEQREWLVRLGVLTVADLVALPRSALAARLGPNAAEVLALCEGHDTTPLVAYEPPQTLVEHTEWEEPVSGIEPLLFVLRGLASRMSARLAGRGQAAQALRLVIQHDRAIARLQGAPLTCQVELELAAPLWREEELRRVVGARLERLELAAPSLGLRLEAPAVTRAAARQLDLAQAASGLLPGSTGLEALPVLLAELTADIGKDRVGVLELVDAHRPEKKSVLLPALRKQRSLRKVKPRKGVHKARPTPSAAAPTRLLPKPVPLHASLRVGGTLSIDHCLYSIVRLRFEQRLEAVKWWAGAPLARDYLRLWLDSARGGLEALVYVDRNTGRRYLHAVAD